MVLREFTVGVAPIPLTEPPPLHVLQWARSSRAHPSISLLPCNGGQFSQRFCAFLTLGCYPCRNANWTYRLPSKEGQDRQVAEAMVRDQRALPHLLQGGLLLSTELRMDFWSVLQLAHAQLGRFIEAHLYCTRFVFLPPTPTP